MVLVQMAINLKEMFWDRYRITLDEAASPRCSDPWYFQIPCQFGHFYPHSSKLIGFFCDSVIILNRLHKEHPELKATLCDGEAIFFFTPDQFEMIAEYAKPKKRRRMSPEQKEKAVERLRRFQFAPHVR